MRANQLATGLCVWRLAMNKPHHSNWPLGLAVIVLLIAVPFAYLTRPAQAPRIEPRRRCR